MVGLYGKTSAGSAALLVTAIAAFHRSSVGRKIIVAVTGVILILFVIGHLLGNLQIFLGPEWINSYAEHLRDLGPLLWVIRAFLLVTVLTPHLLHDPARDRESPRPARALPAQGDCESNIGLTHDGHEWAHPARLHHLSPAAFHRSHHRSALLDPAEGSAQALRRVFHDDPGLSSIQLVSGFYILVDVPACAPSEPRFVELFPKSLGSNNQKLDTASRFAGRTIFAWLLFVGYSSIPAAVLLGWVKLRTHS